MDRYVEIEILVIFSTIVQMTWSLQLHGRTKTRHNPGPSPTYTLTIQYIIHVHIHINMSNSRPKYLNTWDHWFCLEFLILIISVCALNLLPNIALQCAIGVLFVKKNFNGNLIYQVNLVTFDVNNNVSWKFDQYDCPGLGYPQPGILFIFMEILGLS